MAEIKIEKRCAWSDPIDPTLGNNPINAMAEVVKKAVRSVPSCLPARILSYDRVSHTAIVQPLCNAMTNTGDSVERPPIKIHVIRFASGLHKVEDLTQPKGYRIVPGAIIDLPLAIGDTGWIIASDADTQAQKAANAHYFKDEDAGPLNPSTGLIHSFMHGVFIPDSFCSFPKIAEFGDQMVIGTYTYDEENEEAVITPIKTDIDWDELIERLTEELPNLCVTSLNEMKGDITLTAGNRIIITEEIDSETGDKRIRIAAIDQVIPTYTQGPGISISPERVVSNTGVLSVNSLSGNITLAQGTNISLSVNGNTITINATGGGGGGGMFAWTPPSQSGGNGTMGPGGCMIGRRWIPANGTGSKASGHSYWLKVTLSNSGGESCSVVSDPSDTSPSGNDSYIPIYTIDSNGNISVDYRGAFVVPAYE